MEKGIKSFLDSRIYFMIARFNDFILNLTN